MAAGIAPRLPLLVDPVFGPYGLITSYEELAIQNFKMLLLTIPGERMMDPLYGVGLKRFLFELNQPNTYAKINDAIVAQARRYMPFIELNSIDFSVPEDNPDLFPNDIRISIRFTIGPLGRSTSLEMSFDN